MNNREYNNLEVNTRHVRDVSELHDGSGSNSFAVKKNFSESYEPGKQFTSRDVFKNEAVLSTK